MFSFLITILYIHRICYDEIYHVENITIASDKRIIFYRINRNDRRNIILFSRMSQSLKFDLSFNEHFSIWWIIKHTIYRDARARAFATGLSFPKLDVGWRKQIGCPREYLQESKYRQSLAIEITSDLTRFSQFTITRSSNSVLTLDDCFLQQVPLLITRRPRVLVRVPRRLRRRSRW